MTKRLLSLALAAMLLTALIPAAAFAAGEGTMYVYTDNGKTLNVRSAPNTGNNVIGSLKYGAEVTVVATSSNGWSTILWEQVGYYGEFSVAYVQSRFLVYYKPAPKSDTSPSPTAAPSSATDAAKVLSQMNVEFASAKKVNPYTVVSRPSRASGWVNLRWAPTTEAERIATCPQGKELTVLAELKNWYQVQDPATGMIGFISNKYVTRK